jgi:hypothetical protein
VTDSQSDGRSRWPALLAVCAAVAVGVTACGDDPFAFNWSDVPDTVLLYSLARPELNLESGFAFRSGARIRVEAPGATGTWDAAVGTLDGQIVLLPPGALNVVSTARIAEIEGLALEDVREAPGDTMVYVADEPVPVRHGVIYVVKTNRSTGSFGSRCVYYAKMEAVDIDPAGGTLRFRYVTNPVCNSLDLVPPD